MKNKTGKCLSLKLAAFAVLSLVCFQIASAQSARRILRSKPAQHSIVASAGEPIEITLNREFQRSENFENYIWIVGNYYGYYLKPGEITLQGFTLETINANTTLKITLPFETSFADGEDISVLFHPNFFDDGNDGAPVRLNFRVMTKAGISSTGFNTINLQLDPVAVQPVKAVAANLDDDEFLEIALVSSMNSIISIFDNKNKDLSLVYSDSVLATSALDAKKLLTPLDIAAADFNRDGFMDLVVPFKDSRTVILLWGSSGETPSFDANKVERISNAGILPHAVKPVDYNTDGWIDLLVVSRGEDRVYIFENNKGQGSETFSRVQKDLITSEGPVIVTTGDFNADGFIDFATANIARRNVSVFTQNIGGFGSAKVVQLPFRPVDIQALNMRQPANPDQTDYLEIAVLSSDVPYFGKTRNSGTGTAAGTQLTLFEWNRRGETFVKYDSVQLQDQALSFDVADLNGDFREKDDIRDHLLDIALSSFRGNRIDYVFNSNGKIGNIQEVKPIDSPLSILAADLNQDGIEDLVYTGYYTGELVYLRSFGLPKQTFDHNFGDTFTHTCKVVYKEFSLDSPNSVKAELKWGDFADTTFFSVTPLTADSLPQDPANFDIIAHKPNLFLLEFCPGDTGFYRTTLDIVTVLDEGEDHSTLTLIGRGTEIELTFEPDSLIFPVTPPDTFSTTFVNINNTVNDTLFLYRIWRQPAIAEITQDKTELMVLPFSEDSIAFTFAPKDEGDYHDRIFITSNDPDNPQVEIPVYGKSTRNDTIYLHNPEILLTATEDEPFEVLLEISDPDSEESQVLFRIEDNPAWMQLSKNKLSGLAQEGDTTAHFKIITTKLHVRSEHQRTIVVEPVNDAPYFIYMPDTTIKENVLFEFEICATDDEDSTLTVGVVEEDLNSPSLFDPERDNGEPPSFHLTGRNCAVFRWVPPFGKAGNDFQVTFWVEDEEFRGETRIEAQMYMHVYRAKPDLILTDFRFAEPIYSLGQTAQLTATFELVNAPILATEKFSAQIAQGFRLLNSVEFSGPLSIGFADSVTGTLYLDRTGEFIFEAFVDSDKRIVEVDEFNNQAQISMDVDIGNLSVHPNPFSPNGDGINDVLYFDLTQLVRMQPKVEIFTLRGQLLQKLEYAGGNSIAWNGKDSRGREMIPGVYLWIVHNDNKEIGHGYVVLAR